MSGSGFIWNPPPELIERANVTRLRRALGAADYHELHRISIEEPDRFWPAVVDDLGLEFSRRWDTVVDSSRGPEWATWFNGGRLNLARICVHRWASDEEALVGLYEDGARESVTFAEISRQVTQLAEELVELGVGAGDRVALYMPMCPAVAVASHACAHIGAVQVPIFSGFAAPAVATRLADSQAKVVICADWSLRRGKRIEMPETLGRGGDACRRVRDRVEPRDAAAWPDAVTRQPGVLPPLEVDSEAPYLLAYTSGTTGRPKGALHVQGGFLVSIAREVAYQADVNQGDRIHFATDMGWIMGPWTVVGGGAVGATIVFAEGAPDWPRRPALAARRVGAGDDARPLADARARADPEGRAERQPLVAPRVLHDRRAVEPRSVQLALRARRRRTRPDHQHLRRDRGRRVLPDDRAHRADQAGRARLSRARHGDGRRRLARPVRTGQVGELVCRTPWPGMTRGIWRDHERYLDTYWRRFPGVWMHGDWASVDEDGYWFLHGRSDDTLNIAGKRIGPAELESAAIAYRHRRRGGGGRRAARGEGRGGVDLLRAEARRGAATTS